MKRIIKKLDPRLEGYSYFVEIIPGVADDEEGVSILDDNREAIVELTHKEARKLARVLVKFYLKNDATEL